jgi:3-hydroxyisobutyrate dehydrogenase-like beta-hydroxyacid dehydrogenase
VTGAVRVAVVGLGRMGGPIADHLIAAGYDVRVHDPSGAAVEARVARGATAERSPAEAARGADVVSIVVFDDAQATDVVSGPEGVLSTLRPGAVVAVHTTVTLRTLHALAARGATRGVHVLDAGISGGEDGACTGTLLTMVGGPDDAVERARRVLLAYSKEVLHAGPLGAGMTLKLARNATFYTMMAAVHEAMTLARQAGIDLGMLEHTITETGVLDQAMTPFALGGPEALPDDAPEPQRTAMEHLDRLAAKDLDAALDLATGIGVDVPLFAATRSAFRRVARLHGGQNSSSV